MKGKMNKNKCKSHNDDVKSSKNYKELCAYDIVLIFHLIEMFMEQYKYDEILRKDEILSIFYEFYTHIMSKLDWYWPMPLNTSLDEKKRILCYSDDEFDLQIGVREILVPMLIFDTLKYADESFKSALSKINENENSFENRISNRHNFSIYSKYIRNLEKKVNDLRSRYANDVVQYHFSPLKVLLFPNK